MARHCERPFYVTPHAVERFRERVADLPPAQVIEVVQEMLQAPGLPVDAEVRDGKLVLIYRGSYRGKPVYLPVAPGDEQSWPQVVTAMSTESVLHGVLCRAETRRGRKWRLEGRKATIPHLRAAGFTVRECAAILRLGHSTVERHIKRLGLTRRRTRRWTVAELRTLCKMREARKSWREIAGKLGRTETAARVRFCRLLKQHERNLADPDRRAVLRVLSVCLDPGRVLSLARKAGLLDAIKRGTT